MYCSNCGTETKPGDNFCSSCGIPLRDSLTNQAQPKTEQYKEVDENVRVIRRLISEKNKKHLITLLNNTVKSQEEGELLIDRYYYHYNSDLIESLKSLSHSYETIKTLISPFSQFDIVSNKYPHNYLVKIPQMEVTDGKDSEETNLQRKNRGNLFIWFLVIAVSIIGYEVISGDKEEEFKPDKITAYYFAEEFIKEQLKAPSSADFPGFSEKEDHVQQIDANTFFIESWVESQNSFGAQIRSKFTCYITFDGDNVRLTELQIE